MIVACARWARCLQFEREIAQKTNRELFSHFLQYPSEVTTHSGFGVTDVFITADQ